MFYVTNIGLVALGSAIGGIFRYLLSILIDNRMVCFFPFGTLSVNLIGCLLIGVLLGLSQRYEIFNNELKFLLITGFCGGFTTFSTFSSDCLCLLEKAKYLHLFVYLLGSLFLGIIGVWIGYIFSKHI